MDNQVSYHYKNMNMGSLKINEKIPLETWNNLEKIVEEYEDQLDILELIEFMMYK